LGTFIDPINTKLMKKIVVFLLLTAFSGILYAHKIECKNTLPCQFIIQNYYLKKIINSKKYNIQTNDFITVLQVSKIKFLKE